jgi:hypothetical protein
MVLEAVGIERRKKDPVSAKRTARSLGAPSAMPFLTWIKRRPWMKSSSLKEVISSCSARGRWKV